MGKNKTQLYAPHKRLPSALGTDTRRLKEKEKIFHANETPKNLGQLYQTKQTFIQRLYHETKKVIYNKKLVNSPTEYRIGNYALNIMAPKYIKKILTALKGEVPRQQYLNSRNFNTSLSTMDRLSRKKSVSKYQTYYTLDRLQYLQSIPPSSIRLHSSQAHTGILLDRSCVRPQKHNHVYINT